MEVVDYSCADGSNLSTDSITIFYWDSSNDGYRYYSLTTAILTLCIISVGLPNNLLIIISILRQHLHKEPTYILLLNLALADFLLCVFLVPAPVVSGLIGDFKFGRNDVVRCKVCQLELLVTLCLKVTIHTLALLSLDRLIFIKYPLKYLKFVTIKRVIVLMIITWTVSLAISALPLLGFGDMKYGRDLATCTICMNGQTKLTANVHYALLVAIEVFISLFILFAANIWIGLIVRKQIKKIYSLKKNISVSEDLVVNEIKERANKTKTIKHLHLVKAIGSILISNIITWIPFIIYVPNSDPDDQIEIANIIVYTSILSAAAVHPVLQAILIPELKRNFISFYKIHRCCRRKQVQEKLVGITITSTER